jgi:hypothetical protein
VIPPFDIRKEARKNPAYGAGFLNQQDSKSNFLPLACLPQAGF